MVASALNLPEGKKVPFSDVPADAPYAGAVSAMAARGFVSGRGGGVFLPDSPVTYEEMVTVLSAVAAWASMDGYALAQKDVPAGQWLNYHTFSPWAQAPAWRLDQLGALAGGTDPGLPATRQLAAGMLCSLMENIHLLWA